jgi:hypothetical protein
MPRLLLLLPHSAAIMVVADNGTIYGSGMAPAEVLRYATTGNTTRTLTINGLFPTKKYNLELYASRKRENSAILPAFTMG